MYRVVLKIKWGSYTRSGVVCLKQNIVGMLCMLFAFKAVEYTEMQCNSDNKLKTPRQTPFQVGQNTRTKPLVQNLSDYFQKIIQSMNLGVHVYIM